MQVLLSFRTIVSGALYPAIYRKKIKMTVSNVSAYTTLAELKAAPSSANAYILVSTDGPISYAYVLGNFSDKADDTNVVQLNTVPLTTGALVRQSARAVTYLADSTSAKPRSVKSRLADVVSVFDFLSPAQIASVRTRDEQIECTDAVNAAFAYAQATAKTVEFPNGVYIVGNLIFGAQNTSGQSVAPVGLVGQSKAGTTLKARPGLTGTLLKSWSLAGATFRDFSIDCSGTTAQAWDARWRPNDPNRSGPSTQNTIHDIIITGTPTLAQLPDQFPVTPQVNWDDLNDTYPTNVTIRLTDPTHKTCALSFVGSGGLMSMVGCIWTGGYLRWGCQNGELLHSWGTGVEFAAGCLNTTTITAGYPYDNATRKAVYWSESYDSYQSVKSLTLIGGQIGTLHADSCYFDLNLYSTINAIGCEFIGPATALLGPNSRSDSYAIARVKLDGGHHTGNLVVADAATIVVTADNFINDTTGEAVTKDWRGVFTPMLYGGATAGGTFVTGTYGRWMRQGNLIHYQMRLGWSTHPAAGGGATVGGLPFRPTSDSIGNVSLEFRGSTFPSNVSATIGGGTIAFFQDGTQFNLPAIGDIILSGSYTTTA